MSELQPGLEKRLAHVKQMLFEAEEKAGRPQGCLLYTSDAADE